MNIYRVITPFGPTIWANSLSVCLKNIALRLTSANEAHTVTVQQAIDAGYRIVRA